MYLSLDFIKISFIIIHISLIIHKLFTDQKLMENNIFELLHARLLHLAQNILCDQEAARSVTLRAIERFQAQFKENEQETVAQKQFVQWTQAVLDEEIENYFQELIQNIKADSNKAEEKLVNILYRRFLCLANHKMKMDREIIDRNDTDDIVQNALQTVFLKCRRSKPKGTFIQWAQTVLNNKYRERRRINIERKNRFKSISQEEYEPIYQKRLVDVMRRRKSEKETSLIKERPLPKAKINQIAEDPLENDPYHLHPVLLVECIDLKKRLLSLVKKMGEQCKRVFEVLFSQGDAKMLYERFPHLSREQMYVVLSRCRSQLKKEAQKWGILE